jgi:ABC-2 type transport system permease protein
MAVYKRNYKRFHGDLTDQWGRFTVLPRYAIQTVFESKALTSYFTLCLIPHFIAMVLIYLHHNLGALKSLDLTVLQHVEINGNFFLSLFEVETYMSFLLVTFIGPGLIAPDLANNALPLYLSRPFSKTEYTLGKLSVLLAVTSLITWIPGLLLIGIQTDEAGLSWLRDNVRLPIGIFVGSCLWILTVSLVALALSAWIKMRPGAIFALVGIFFIAASFGNLANVMLNLNPPIGLLIDLNATMRALWRWLLLGENSYAVFVPRDRFDHPNQLSAWLALVSLLTFCALSLGLQRRFARVRSCAEWLRKTGSSFSKTCRSSMAKCSASIVSA